MIVMVKQGERKKELRCCLLPLKKWQYPVFQTLGTEFKLQQLGVVEKWAPSASVPQFPTCVRVINGFYLIETDTRKSLKKRRTKGNHSKKVSYCGD